MTAPDVINLEVLSTLRRLEWVGALPAVWELRAKVTSYDACYVALAEALGCTLAAADLKLFRAPRLGVPLITV
jgi:predicted nucleic acid-binding protein